MANKRKVNEAFGQPRGQLSAVAAAKLARQRKREAEPEAEADDLAAEVGAIPYDGHHSGTITPIPADTEGRVEDVPIAVPPEIKAPVLEARSDNVLVRDVSTMDVHLAPGEACICMGEYDLQVLDTSDGFDGAIHILGAYRSSKNARCRIYAPITHPLPPIHAFNGSVTIRISSIASGIRELEKLSPKFRNIWTANAAAEERSFNYLGTFAEKDLEQSGYNLFRFDKRISDIRSSIGAKAHTPGPSSNPHPRVLAIGAKSSGKSTFNRMLCNYLNSSATDISKKCLYLDLDPGQPEFTPAGQITLIEVTGPIIGPSFIHPAIPQATPYRLIRSHATAATSFKDHPEHYKACVADLVSYIDSTLPLIINTCGWVTGLGAEVLLDLIPLLRATDTILFEPLEECLTQTLLQQKTSEQHTFHRIPRHPPRPLSRTPAESRAMQTMAYFHHRPSNASSPHPTWSGKPLSRKRPWIVKYTSPSIAIASYGQSPEPNFLAEVLDGCIVAIVVIDPTTTSETLFLPSKDSLSTTMGASSPSPLRDLSHLTTPTPETHLPLILPSPKTGTTHPLNPTQTHCLSLALIRSIDTEAKELHLLTPLPESQILALQDQNVVLVRGAFDTPEWAYLEDVYSERTEEATEGSREGRRKWKREAGRERPWVVAVEEKAGGRGVEGGVWRERHPPVLGQGEGRR